MCGGGGGGVGCFGLNGPSDSITVYIRQSCSLPERGRKKREMIDESKNVQTTQSAPTVSPVGPCPAIINLVGRPGTASLPSTIAPPDHPGGMEGRKAGFAGKSVDTDRITKNPNIQIQIFYIFPLFVGEGEAWQGKRMC